MTILLPFLPLLVAAQPALEDIPALDVRLSQASSGQSASVDPRLRLARCPQPPSIERVQQAGFEIACAQVGWRVRVPLAHGAQREMASAAQSVLVHRGESVQVVIAGESYSVNYQAVAVEAGRLGDAVRVRFAPGNTILVATVSGQGRVHIAD